MIILNKKRLLFLNLIIVISVFYYSISNNSLPKIESVSSIPIAEHTIILDAGHGKPDGGATSQNGVIESDLNLNIVLKLQNLLESSNCNVILTRSDENGIYEETAETIREKKISDMKNRAKLANTSNAELFLSIHMNKISETQYSGFQTFFKNNDEISKQIAGNIQTSLNYFLKKDNKRTIKSISNIYLSKNVEIPLVIVECGFLSNEEETNLLNTDSYQDELAWSIYIGIMDYFK